MSCKLETQQICPQCYFLELQLRPFYRFQCHTPLCSSEQTLIPLVSKCICDLLSNVSYQCSLLKSVYL